MICDRIPSSFVQIFLRGYNLFQIFFNEIECTIKSGYLLGIVGGILTKYIFVSWFMGSDYQGL
jgi:hypothetical protein